MDTFRSAVSGFLLQFAPTPEMPRIRAKSRVPGALRRVRALNPQLRAQIGKVLFVALGSQFAILAAPYFGNLTLDYIVAADNRNLLNVLVVTFSSIFIFGALSEFVQKYLTELLFSIMQINTTEGLIGHLLRNLMSWFEKRHVGDVFARVKAQDEVRRTTIYMTVFKAYASAALKKARLTCTRDGLLKLVNYADTIIITWMAARLMLGGAVSVGVFYSFLIYKSLMTERFANAINATFQYFMLSVPVARVDDIVEAKTERYTTLADSQRATEVRDFRQIDVRDVTFNYGISDDSVLRNLSFTVNKGDKIVITGPSGSGKSTLFKLLCAAEPLQNGHMALNGIAWANLAVDEIRRHMAHMRQGDIILHGSIADNVTLFAGNTDENRVHKVLADVGLLDDVMRLPMRTRTVISDTIANISAGQRQRLLLARALSGPRGPDARRADVESRSRVGASRCAIAAQSRPHRRGHYTRYVAGVDVRYALSLHRWWPRA